jgi:hypothetical protein
MPCGDLARPLLDFLMVRPSRRTSIGIDSSAKSRMDFSDPRIGEFRVAVCVCLTDHLFRVPREPHEAFVLITGESLGRDRESTPDPVERIVLAAPMLTHGLVLHASTALIERSAATGKI